MEGWRGVGGVEEGSGVTGAEIKQSGRTVLRCLAQLWRGGSHVPMTVVWRGKDKEQIGG